MISQHEGPNDVLARYIEKLTRAGFWGVLTLKYEGGKVVFVKEERSWKPCDLPAEPSDPRRSVNVHLNR